MSEEERAKMRERWQNMTEEEKEKFRTQMRERFGAAGAMFGREAQLEAIKAIEEQLAKLKAGMQAPGPAPGTSFQNLSEEEKTKLREQFTKTREGRQNAIRTIVAQIARLQGRVQPPAEGEQFIIVNTADLKALRELAVKEKAKETEDRITAMIEAGQRGFGFGRFPFPGGPPGQPGERGTRPGPQRGAGTPGGAG
jgi:DNA repair exonuclease SbcCD ATPase subunit